MLEIFTAIKLGKAILKRLKRVENRDELINTIIAAMGDGTHAVLAPINK